MSKPSTQHGYSYVSNNSVNRTDPSGLCEEIADESCWSLYEQIVRKYPEAKNKTYFYNGQWVSLQKLPWSRLNNFSRELSRAHPGYFTSNQDILRNIFTLKRPDAVGIYISIHGTEIPFSGQTGFEFIYNFKSKDTTAFAVIGLGGAIGADITGQGQFLAIYNIEDRNLDYSGNFVGLGAQGAALYGVGGQYSITPEDFRNVQIFNPEGPYSVGVGPVCGYGLSGGASLVEYIPILTTNNTTGLTYHAGAYLYDGPTPDNPNGQFDNGFITGLVTEDIPRYYRLIQEKIKEYGWDKGGQ